MQIPEEVKDKISSLLDGGDKLGAVRYIQETLSLSAEDALALAERLDEQRPAVNTGARKEGINLVRVVGVIFTIVGFILLSLSFYFGYRDFRFSTKAAHVPGKIARIESRPHSSKGKAMYGAVVSYVFDGTSREYASPASSSSPGYSVGDDVELLVDPNDPSQVAINSFLDRWFVVTILGGMGLVFSGIGYLVRKYGS